MLLTSLSLRATEKQTKTETIQERRHSIVPIFQNSDFLQCNYRETKRSNQIIEFESNKKIINNITKSQVD